MAEQTSVTTWYHLTLTRGTDQETLTCTGQHPFYSSDAQRFIPATELAVGERLELEAAGPTAHITDIQIQRGPPAGDGRFTT